MTLLEQLLNHKGRLIRLKTQLYWYGIGLDNKPGRVCLVMNVNNKAPPAIAAEIFPNTTMHRVTPSTVTAAALLLIDGSPQWVWVDTKTVEFINDPG